MIISIVHISFTSAVPQLRLVEPGGVYGVNEGSELNVECIAEVYPVTSLEWVKIVDGQPGAHQTFSQTVNSVVIYISPSEHPALVTTTSSSANLTFSNVSINITGTYVCVARTPYIMNNITANVVVLCEFKLYISICLYKVKLAN